MKKLITIAVFSLAATNVSAMTTNDCEYFGELATSITLDRDNGYTANDSARHIVKHQDKMSDSVFMASLLMANAIHDSALFERMTPFAIGKTYYEACITVTEKNNGK